MKVKFRTQLDMYNTNCFPENLQIPPHVGEFVLVNEGFGAYYASKNLPTRLEVISVTWCEAGVICELWYNKLDKEIAERNNAKLFG